MFMVHHTDEDEVLEMVLINLIQASLVALAAAAAAAAALG